MKTILIFNVLILLGFQLSAQCNFDQLIKEGKSAAKREDFELAINKFNSARRCDPTKGDEVDKAVDVVFRAIKRQRDEAKEQRGIAVSEKQRAEEQQKLAEKEKQRAEAQTKIAQAARDSVATLLQKFEAASAEIVDALMREANNLIYHLDYPAAAAKLRTAADLNQPTAAFKKTLAEVAFFWNEAGQTKRAADLLIATKQLDVPREKASMQSWLQHYAGVWHDTLFRRYYPNMLLVSCGEADIYGKKALVSTFKIACTETTMWQYALFSSANGKDLCAHKNLQALGWGISGDNPMVKVSWYDAARYANWLSKQFKRDIVYIFEDDAFKQINYSAKGYRLPTEVEWEFAARVGSTQEVFEYAGSNELDSVAWNSNNSGNRSQPVAGKKANSLGLYDMSGNVWEWCGDWRADYPAIFPANYHGPEKGWSRVIRGGSWNLSTDYFRLRNNDAPDSRYYACGFRLAFTP